MTVSALPQTHVIGEGRVLRASACAVKQCTDSKHHKHSLTCSFCKKRTKANETYFYTPKGSAVWAGPFCSSACYQQRDRHQ